MKIVVTGSLGHISKPLATMLVEEGHSVTVIGSNAERRKDIEALGAQAAIGSVEDVAFLTAAFAGADAAYCMVPPKRHLDPNLDTTKYYTSIGSNYAEAIRQTGIKRVVHLSSIGAHMDKDSGIILAHRHIEDTLKTLTGVGLTHMRPTAFYYNLFAFVEGIKKHGAIASNYGGDDRVPWVSPLDIAAAVAEEIVTPLAGRKIQYVASDEPTCNEIASVLGAAIGMPGLRWNLISNEALQSRLESTGLSKQLAAGLAEMNASIHSGALSEDYYRNRPVLGKVKIADFAKEFAAVFNQK